MWNACRGSVGGRSPDAPALPVDGAVSPPLMMRGWLCLDHSAHAWCSNCASPCQLTPVAPAFTRQGKVYWAVAGKGAWARESPASPPRQLHCATFRETDPGLVIVGSASHASQETAEFVGEFRAPQFRAVGSSLKLLMVAEGAAHMYPRLAPTCEWDTAAAHAIVEEAGGRVLQAGRCDSSGNALEGWRVC